MKAAQSPASTTATTNDAGIRTRDAGSGHGEYERIPDPESRIPVVTRISAECRACRFHTLSFVVYVERRLTGIQKEI